MMDRSCTCTYTMHELLEAKQGTTAAITFYPLTSIFVFAPFVCLLLIVFY
jgi:hypothetical protein